MVEAQLIPHPMLVHFPLVLLPLALLAEAAGLVFRRAAWFRHVAVLLLVLGASAAGAAYLTGRVAADAAGDIAAGASAAIGEHADWATATLWTFAVLAVLRLIAAWREPALSRRSSRLARGVLAALLLPAMLLLFETGEHGAALVYEHGVGVNVAAESPPVPTVAVAGEAAADSPRPAVPVPADSGVGPASRLVRNQDGTVLWTPQAGDIGALRDLVTVSSLAADSTIKTRELTPPIGLPLTCKGRSVLWVPGSFGDVVLRARVRLEGFTGTIGVVHHGDDSVSVSGGVFALDTRGNVQLGRFTASGIEAMDEAHASAPSDTVEIGVSAIGRHLKGMIDGKVATHAHASAPAQGRVGLLLDGTGDLSIISMEAVPPG